MIGQDCPGFDCKYYFCNFKNTVLNSQLSKHLAKWTTKQLYIRDKREVTWTQDSL